MLPKVCKQRTRHTGATDDEPLIIFVQHLEVHTRVAIKVLWLITVGYQLEKIIETCLVLGSHHKMTATIEGVELFLLSVLVLDDHPIFFFLLLLGVGLVLLVHCTPFTMGLNEVGFASVDGSEVFAVCLHLFQMFHLK